MWTTILFISNFVFTVCYKNKPIVIYIDDPAITDMKICFMGVHLTKSKSTMVAGIIDDIRRVFYVLAEQSRKAEIETGLTGSQLWVIKMLEGTSPMKVTDLARRMYLHPATMVGLLDRLEAKGLVQRARSEKDRRVVHVFNTDLGRELVQNSPEVAKEMLVKGLEPLSEKRIKMISVGLDQIVELLGVREEPPKLIHSSESNLPGRRRKSAA
jgi:DNA-binding MarR family transcriptional regulator